MEIPSKELNAAIELHINERFKDVSSCKSEHEPNLKVVLITIFFSAGITQQIYVSEDIVLELADGKPEKFVTLLEEYEQDSAVYNLLQKEYPEGNSYGFRCIGDTDEWVARVNYPDKSYQIIEGKGTEIVFAQDRVTNSKANTYTDLQKELSKFVEDPEVLRTRALTRKQYGLQESLDSLFEERDA